MKPFRLAMISLDSSHAVEFTRIIQSDPANPMEELRIVACCRFPSVFQPEEGQDARQKQLEEWGVVCKASLEEAAADADGLLISLNNPADHLPMVEKAVKLKKPFFLDKPVADTLANARAIDKLARDAGVRYWSSSSIPLADSVDRARRTLPNPKFAYAYGPLGKAAAGSDVVWYGCHTFETMIALMGDDALAVQAMADPAGVVARVEFSGDRRGLIELDYGHYNYGGRVASDEISYPFQLDGKADAAPYARLVPMFRDFFLFNRQPFPASYGLAAMALADATDQSLAAGGQRIVL